MQGWRWALAQLTRRLWVRASLYGVAGVAVALLAAAFSRYVPDALAKPFGGNVVNALLNVLASSLLSVATFSTAAMLTAYTNISQGATPRAAALITGDRRAQGALSSFIGAFLYSVVAFSALGTGYYANGGRAILFAVTILMLVWVAVTLLRWLDQLLDIARVGHAVDKVEAAAREAIGSRFGAGLDPAGWSDPPEDTLELESGEVGYVANVDVERLRKLAHKHGLELWVTASPGAFVHARYALLRVRTDRPLPPEAAVALRAAFDVADGRSYDQDPRFGFVVLGEVAAKALSPGINDPGTAIDVIGTAVRLLTDWRRRVEGREHCDAPHRVHLRPPGYDDLLDDV
ncbi:MAG: DUF2254 domain-containing protein, partial [Caulobacteraceae bacterium]|nr:DUF2254 domain-containing protein [Caulobacter sp.]